MYCHIDASTENWKANTADDWAIGAVKSHVRLRREDRTRVLLDIVQRGFFVRVKYIDLAMDKTLVIDMKGSCLRLGAGWRLRMGGLRQRVVCGRSD